ncbi:MAG: hypothetical protein ACRC42_03855 [Mycoplasma sp.]
MERILYKLFTIIFSGALLLYVLLFALKFHESEIVSTWEWTKYIGIEWLVEKINGFASINEINWRGVVILEAGLLLFFAYNTTLFIFRLIPFIERIFKVLTTIIWILSAILVIIGCVCTFIDFGIAPQTAQNILNLTYNY